MSVINLQVEKQRRENEAQQKIEEQKSPSEKMDDLLRDMDQANYEDSDKNTYLKWLAAKTRGNTKVVHELQAEVDRIKAEWESEK